SVLILPVFKIWHRHGTKAIRFERFRKIDELFGLRERQWFEQHCVDGGEDRSVGADAECKCECSDQSEAGSLCHHANAIAQILDEVPHATAPQAIHRLRRLFIYLCNLWISHLTFMTTNVRS